MRLIQSPAGPRLEAAAYAVTFPADRPFAVIEDAAGARWAELALLAALDTAEGLDDTVSVSCARPAVGPDGWRLEVETGSSRWPAKTVLLEGDEATFRVAARVEGRGRLTDVRLLGGTYSGDPGRGTGELVSAAAFGTVFSPEPADPGRVCRSAAEPVALDVVGGGRPGQGHWFFTPPPFCLAFSRSAPAASRRPCAVPAGPWLAVGLLAPVEDQTFTALRYEPAERAFSFVLRYEGQTRVDGLFQTPWLSFSFDAPDPYAAIAGYAETVRRQPAAHLQRAVRRPDRAVQPWWREPMFCGWGAQAREAERAGIRAAELSRQDRYDAWLAELASHGLRPGTIVVDDKWQAEYGTCRADPARWPDLAGWIERRHAEGQRVLLWWKAWDPEGLPGELCVRNAAGLPVAADPTNAGYEASLRESVRGMLAPPPAGYGADGLKVDFTARTPSGAGLSRHGTAWGVALLHRLLEIVADEAARTKPGALIVTHAPHPLFEDVTGMLRLNDMQRLDEPDDPAAVVPQMLHRARVARAACPGLPIDTDDWCAPDLGAWRRYLGRKLELGVPALYYVAGLDRAGGDFEEADYAALRRVWASARRQG